MRQFREQDFFILIFGLLLLLAFFLKIPTSPFRFSSLFIVFIFLLTTRSFVEGEKFFPYLLMAILGLLLASFLSPYSVLIFFVVAVLINNVRTHL